LPAGHAPAGTCGQQRSISKGPGRIERAIRALLDAHPDLAFVTDELCEHCYPNATKIERKHQVAVLRAAMKVIKDDPDWRAWRIAGMGRGRVFVNHANGQSYALGESIAGGWPDDPIYRSPGRAARKPSKWARAGPGFRSILYEPRIHLTDRAELRHYTGAPDERAIRAVTNHIAWRDGNAEARATWAREREEWLAEGKRLADRIRGKSFEATDGVGNETLSSAAFMNQFRGVLGELGDVARALIMADDPDQVRDGLRQIADALDRLGGRLQPTFDATAA
jgi:hypothetical protein